MYCRKHENKQKMTCLAPYFKKDLWPAREKEYLKLLCTTFDPLKQTLNRSTYTEVFASCVLQKEPRYFRKLQNGLTKVTIQLGVADARSIPIGIPCPSLCAQKRRTKRSEILENFVKILLTQFCFCKSGLSTQISSSIRNGTKSDFSKTN